MTRKADITFGTSGWRAILGEDFTFGNAALVVRAIADELLSEGKTKGGVVVSHDTRFLGPRFALQAARILSGAGLTPLLTDRDSPTPVIAHAVLDRKADGGINFTASHNPAEYQGIKFSPENGGPAPKELTKALEKRVKAFQDSGFEPPLGPAPQDRIDPAPAYLKRLAELVDLGKIRASGLRLLLNPLYGTSRGYLDRILQEAGCPAEMMNDTLNPSFGGLPPEPAPEYVGDFLARLDSGKFDLGLATDGDADRFGIFAPGGVMPNANEVIALLLDHLVTSRGWKGFVVRSVATSHFIDAVARHHGCEVIEVPVGFKWIAAEMEKNPGGFVIGGEESGGLTIRGHVPEKDGVLACLLVAEMVAMKGKPVGALLEDLKERTARLASRRVNIHFDAEERTKLLERAGRPRKELAGRKVARTVTMDGFKFILDDDSWLMLRFSGTEPVIRLYLEGPSSRLEEMEKSGRAILAET